MEEPADFHTRQVYVGKQGEMARGSIELPTSFFEDTGIEPGHHVVLLYGRKQYRVKAKLNDLVKGDEVMVAPRVAAVMDLKDGFQVHLMGRESFEDRVFDEIEDVLDVVERKADELKEFIVEEGAERRERRREGVLDRVFQERTREPEKDYIEVEPDLSTIGEEREEKPAPEVKVWSPDPDGDGEVPIFRPGKDEEEEE